MRWQDLFLGQQEAIWRIPLTKSGSPVTITLTRESLNVLRERRKAVPEGCEWVFPSYGGTGHVVEPKKAWKRILDRAGIKNLRRHDLRRTLGSWQAATGASLPIIGKSLGHKPGSSATAIYARLDLDPVRKSVESATAAMLKAAKRA